MTLFFIPRILWQPQSVFRQLAEAKPSVQQVFLGYVLWLGLLPPVCAFVGMQSFGWHFGIGESVQMSGAVALWVAVAYYICLFLGFAVSVLVMRWMAPTYGASTHAGLNAALTAIVGTPLMLGGLLHLYPLLPLNLLAIIPALIWSVYLLYTGLPLMLGVDSSRGMLMASAMLGVFFVGVVSIAVLTMILWVNGIGPDIGFDWQTSV